MASVFRIDQHVIEGQHIRQYPGGSKDQETALKLYIKQYSPLDNPKPRAGDTTIIAAHANGFIKELYEPLFEEILLASQKSKFIRIRSIWIADVAQQGASAVANELVLGNDPHYFDLSRDLLHMVNIFRDQMPHPILGVGHSIGGTSLAHLSFIHPRLFAALVLIDPAIYSDRSSQADKILEHASLKPDFWKSREELETWVRQNRVYRTWDPRVIDRLLSHGVRDTPSLVHPDKGVTFKTSKHQEAFMVGRPKFQGVGGDSEPLSLADRRSHPDLDSGARKNSAFYRAEAREVYRLLPFLRPSILFLHGDKTAFTSPEQRLSRLNNTGSGPGGSGGAPLGRVSEVVLNGGHLLPFENVEETGRNIALYFDEEIHFWQMKEQQWQSQWKGKSTIERQTMDNEWLSKVKNLRQTKAKY